MKKIFIMAICCFLGIFNGAFSVDGSSCALDDTKCKKIDKTGDTAKGCTQNQNPGDPCDEGYYRHATQKNCQLQFSSKANRETLSCTAYECVDDWYLWLDEGHSQGICHSKEAAERECKKGCDKCKPDEECQPYLVPTPITNKKNGAYDGCHCAPKLTSQEQKSDQNQGGQKKQVEKDDEKTENSNDEAEGIEETPIIEKPSEDEKTCSYFMAATFKCTTGLYCAKDNYTVTGCSGDKTINDQQSFDTLMLGNDNLLFLREACKKNPLLTEAEETLAKFFKSVDANRSVWRDADGNFNKARLISDVSAGVVLGTVGGVVSGVVIKKKQVERGFDALHCTVGGQTVADWGDEFSVGLQQ